MMSKLFFPILISLLFVNLILPMNAVGMSADDLYQKLLKADFANLPAGFSAPTLTAIEFTEQTKGPVGGVEATFSASAKTGIVYLVFSDFNSASEYNRKHLPPTIPNQKLLAYPPMARCAPTPSGTGYCDLWIERYSVIMITAATQSDTAAKLMDIGFKHLAGIAEQTPTENTPPSAKSTGSCALLSKQEVESALHQSTRNPEPNQTGGCFFGSTSSGDGITIESPGTGKSGFDAAKGRTRGMTPLSGIGDDAFAFASMAGFVQINLIKNNKYITLIYMNQRDSARMQTAQGLAKLIAGRL
jgi:hypothetical protein